MQTAKLFVNGRSQAVRLPKNCRFPGEDVYIKKFENIVILMAKEDPWSALIDSLDRFSDDFIKSRNQPLSFTYHGKKPGMKSADTDPHKRFTEEVRVS